MFDEFLMKKRDLQMYYDAVCKHDYCKEAKNFIRAGMLYRINRDYFKYNKKYNHSLKILKIPKNEIYKIQATKDSHWYVNRVYNIKSQYIYEEQFSCDDIFLALQNDPDEHYFFSDFRTESPYKNLDNTLDLVYSHNFFVNNKVYSVLFEYAWINLEKINI